MKAGVVHSAGQEANPQTPASVSSMDWFENPAPKMLVLRRASRGENLPGAEVPARDKGTKPPCSPVRLPRLHPLAFPLPFPLPLQVTADSLR